MGGPPGAEDGDRDAERFQERMVVTGAEEKMGKNDLVPLQI